MSRVHTLAAVLAAVMCLTALSAVPAMAQLADGDNAQDGGSGGDAAPAAAAPAPAPAAAGDASDGAAAASLVTANSFAAPFVSFDALGTRNIANWRVGGSAFLNENFLRLTPDRASKRGFVWNVVPIESPDHFTVTLTFRVSGQGKTLFGDGFALWATTHNRHTDGSLHGFTDTFTGVAVVFDTFRNLESGHVHKDVAVLASDGSAPYNTESGVEPPGCDGDFRYHEGRDDFTVGSKSVAQITFNRGKLSIKLDAKNSGQFVDCVSDYTVPIHGAWWDGLHLGITASTGQLADNHDILAVETVAGDAPATAGVDTAVMEVASTGNPQIDQAIKTTVEAEVKALSSKLQHLHHHMEHQVTAIQDSITHTLKKMQQKEEENLQRIEKLEAKLAEQLTSQVTESVERRLGKLEAFLSTSLEAKMKDQMGSEVNAKVAEHVRDTVQPHLEKAVKGYVGQQMEENAAGWFSFSSVAIVLLFGMIMAVAGTSYYQHQKLKKAHYF